MKFYLAPMEGVTGYIFRNAFHKHFGGADLYMSPFISPTEHKGMNFKEKADVLPEHNQGMKLVPQILTNKSDLFLKAAKELAEYGYEEVNLNLGCPSGTVVAKGRGSGFLAQTAELEKFLDEIFDKCQLKISIKTRIGKESVEDFDELLQMFNRYPVSELIIHPRIQKEFYSGKPHWDVFEKAVQGSTNPLCYNGDINSISDYQRFCKQFPTIDSIMIGRGILKSPDLLCQIRDESKRNIKPSDLFVQINMKENCEEQLFEKYHKKDVFRAFHDEIYAGYEEIFSGDKNVLFKMKELWFYLASSFEDSERPLKKIRKAQKKDAYFDAVEMMFEKNF